MAVVLRSRADPLANQDTTIVATLTAPISSSFDSLSLLSWLASGYLIANSACQPLSGKLTDIFSRRYGLLFSNVFFAAGTLICGLAPNAQTIIAGRVIAGVSFISLPFPAPSPVRLRSLERGLAGLRHLDPGLTPATGHGVPFSPSPHPKPPSLHNSS